MKHVLLCLVDYLPIKDILALSLTSRTVFEDKDISNAVSVKYGKTGTELFTDYEMIVNELVKAVEADDLRTVTHVLAYPTSNPFLVPQVLQLAAIYGSRRVFKDIAPRMIPEIDDLVESDSWDLPVYLCDTIEEALKTNDASIYEDFFAALEGTSAGARTLLYKVSGDSLDVMVWYSYISVVTKQDSSAYDVLKRYLGEDAEPGDVLGACNSIQTPEIVKYLVESKLYTKDQLLEFSISTDYVKGEITYEDLVEEYRETVRDEVRNIICMM